MRYASCKSKRQHSAFYIPVVRETNCQGVSIFHNFFSVLWSHKSPSGVIFPLLMKFPCYRWTAGFRAFTGEFRSMKIARDSCNNWKNIETIKIFEEFENNLFFLFLFFFFLGMLFFYLQSSYHKKKTNFR